MATRFRLLMSVLTTGAAALTVAACSEPAEDVVLDEASSEPAPQAPESSQDSSASPLGGGRQGLRIVGSSTVFPFSTTVAENFGAKTQFPTPVVESTGTGGGMNLFCAGVGLSFPDMTGASRAMKASEYQLCQDNGVTAITEIPIGFDGIIEIGRASCRERVFPVV